MQDDSPRGSTQSDLSALADRGSSQHPVVLDKKHPLSPREWAAGGGMDVPWVHWGLKCKPSFPLVGLVYKPLHCQMPSPALPRPPGPQAPGHQYSGGSWETL